MAAYKTAALPIRLHWHAMIFCTIRIQSAYEQPPGSDNPLSRVAKGNTPRKAPEGLEPSIRLLQSHALPSWPRGHSLDAGRAVCLTWIGGSLVERTEALRSTYPVPGDGCLEQPLPTAGCSPHAEPCHVPTRRWPRPGGDGGARTLSTRRYARLADGCGYLFRHVSAQCRWWDSNPHGGNPAAF